MCFLTLPVNIADINLKGIDCNNRNAQFNSILKNNDYGKNTNHPTACSVCSYNLQGKVDIEK